MKHIAVVLFVALGAALLLDLRHPYNKRGARWGKRGNGPIMSAVSIIVVAATLLGLAVIFTLQLQGASTPPDLEIIVGATGFVGALIMGVIDIVIEAKQKKAPNQPPEPMPLKRHGSS